MDHEASQADVFLFQNGVQLPAHEVHGVVFLGPGLRRMRHDGFRESGGVLHLRDLAGVFQQPEHDVPDFSGFFRVLEGGKIIRAVDDACQRGAFRKGEVAGLLVVIAARRGGYSQEGVAPENAVDVGFQNFVLAVGCLNAFGQGYFRQLAVQVAFLVVIRDFGKLHGQGGGALRGSFMLDDLGDGAAHADPVHAAVVVKAIVFTEQQCIYKNGRNFLKGNASAVLSVQGADGPVFAVENNRAFRNVAFHFRNVVAVGNGAVQENENGTDDDAYKGNAQQDAEGPADEPADIAGQGADEAERHCQNEPQGSEDGEARFAPLSGRPGTPFRSGFFFIILNLGCGTGCFPWPWGGRAIRRG